MHKKRPGLSSIVACCLALGAAQAQAAGFGDSGTGAVLGQPLDFVVQLRVEPGEVLEPQCVVAEVMAGDRRLPAALVRTALDRTGPDSARVRVATTQGLDEPVIGVLLQLGCSARIARRFVLLADPPTYPIVSAQTAAPAMAAVPLVGPTGAAAGVAANGGALPVAERNPGVDARSGVGPSNPSAAATSPPAVSPAVSPRAAARPTQLKAAAPVARQPERKLQVASAVPTPKPASPAMPPVKTARADTTPRLRLDVADGPQAGQAVEQALQAVAQAASAARTASAAASAAEARLATLERTVEQLHSEARQHRAEAGEMRDRMRRSESASPWLWPLLVGLLLLAGLAAWLARELAVLRRAQRRTWQHGLKAAQAQAAESELAAATKTPTSPIPFVTSEIALPVASPGYRGATPAGRAWPPPVPAQAFAAASTQAPDTLLSDFQPRGGPPPLSADERATHRTMPLPQVGFGPDAGSPRDVSIEELIDLEQQAEFFVVLGQDEAAVDLLVEHLRSTGGGSPLPYLKLLEIHHRRGDHAAYDRTRSRFNQRFNAYAPDWDSGLQHGRSLEDYAGILPRLQQVWPRPLDAMAELEALLFRKSRGDLFDLPAYRDVLFLYSLARDLLDREAASTGDVDLLLPLADGGDFGLTTPHPYFGLDHDSVFDGTSSDEMPTSPVDLDLSSSDRPARSIFDPLLASRPRD